MKTFGGDAFGTNSHQCFLIPRSLLRGSSFAPSSLQVSANPDFVKLCDLEFLRGAARKDRELV